MTTDLANQSDLAGHIGLAPELRMAYAGYQAEFGRPPAAIWQVPGLVTLLASGPQRLTVATPWGAIAATGPGADGILELVRMEWPGRRDCVPVADAATGECPAWARAGLASTHAG